MSDWEQSLLSLEKLDRSSPELWPEPIPGVTEYAARNAISSSSGQNNLDSLTGPLTEDDLKLLNYYSNLSQDALIQELRKIHDTAYRLGLEESKEMTRGRFLNILTGGRRK